MKKVFYILSFVFLVNGAFAQNKSLLHINNEGQSVQDRILLPTEYVRPPFPETSFQYFLRNLPMKNAGAKVRKFDGFRKSYECYVAVVELDFSMKYNRIHGEHLVQLLRSEYLYKQQKYDMILFHYDDNRSISFEEYGEGYRFVWQDSIYVKQKIAAENYSSETWSLYMSDLYDASSTIGLYADTKTTDFGEVSVGDVFIQTEYNGAPGHTVMVMDMAVHPVTGERLVLLGQGFNPTQDFHILDNPFDEDISPWYRVEEDAFYFTTSQWNFRKKHCRRFVINVNSDSFSPSSEEVTEE